MGDPAEKIVMCTHPGCVERAAAEYVWAWGERGAACSEHIPLIRQQAANLKREVTFVPILSAAAPPTRDERIALNARVLTLEAELDDAKARGLNIYEENTRLAGQLNALQAKNAELEVQAADARAQKESALKATGSVRKELAAARDELEKAKTAAKFSAPPNWEKERREREQLIEVQQAKINELKAQLQELQAPKP